jgi:hypothetical protein
VIAAVTFIIGGLCAWWHYGAIGRVVFGPWTIWNFWFCAVVIAAGVDALRTKDRDLALAWAIQAIAFVVSLTVWKISANPLVDLTIKNLIVMAALLLVCFKPETGLSAILHGLVILAAYLAAIGVIPSAGQRPRAFLAWSYPDIAAGLQHLSLIIIGGLGAAQNAVLGWGHRRGLMAASAGVPVLQTEARE